MITLTTDFGASAYVGAMKGSILSVNPEARVVDVTHAIPPHDVVQGALALYAAAPYFPAGTVHVGVVDPGVGTARRGLVVETRDAFLVGPDNGLLVPAALRLGLRRVRAIQNPRLHRADVSPTFHGRDIFGPVAARLAGGLAPADVGPEVEDFVRLDFGIPTVEEGGIAGRVLSVDAFGNAITNVPADLLGAAPAFGDSVEVAVAGRRIEVRYVRTYGDVPQGEACLLVGSAGFVEVAVNRGNAARALGIEPGAPVRISLALPA